MDEEGYFDTGDLASIDDKSNLTIEGRTKDLIKSGGEWINPNEIETIVGRLPGVGLVAVIGCSDAKWGERPVLVVEPHKGHVLDEKALLAVLRGKVADWWIPDQVVWVSEMPLSATGKIDKILLACRARQGTRSPGTRYLTGRSRQEHAFEQGPDLGHALTARVSAATQVPDQRVSEVFVKRCRS